jgi:alpha-amylase
VYAAKIAGRNGELYVRVGGSDQQWQPSAFGYTDYREYAQGAGWKVWVKRRRSDCLAQAQRRSPSTSESILLGLLPA